MKNFKDILNEGMKRTQRIELSMANLSDKLSDLSSDYHDYQTEPTLFDYDSSPAEKIELQKKQINARLAALEAARQRSKEKTVRRQLKNLKPIQNPHEFGYNPMAHLSFNPMDIAIKSDQNEKS